MNHLNAAASLATRTDESYVTRAETIFVQKVAASQKNSKDPWRTLVGRAPIRDALNDLLDISPKDAKKGIYGAVRKLLNTISREYLSVLHGNGIHNHTPAVIFSSLHNHVVTGDHLAVKTKPDWQAFMGQYEGLVDVLKYPIERIDASLPHPALCGVGEEKPKETALVGQFKYYVGSNKRYRPDITTVHGFQLGGEELYLSSVNPFGLVSSEAFDRGNLEAWVALVVLLYHSCDTRDERLTYHPAGFQDSCRWDIRSDPDSQDEALSVFPNHASHAPGRMTWTAFVPGEIPGSRTRNDYQRRISYAPAIGFVKVSWQRPSVLEAAPADQTDPPPKLPLTEGELLQHAHQDGWLPGLVRYHKFQQSDVKIETEIDGEPHVRFKEILHLASVGEPLSQCDTPLHILEVFYDLVETHLQLLKRDILHRDPSWFNVLCNPEHDPATLAGGKAVLKGIPCIEKIFGKPNGQPAVLLVDLDHSAHVDRIWKPGYKKGIERTGTPMFVAVELSASDDQRLSYTSGQDLDALDLLVSALKGIEAHADIYQEAFPDGSGAIFMAKFAEVVKREEARLTARPRKPLFSDPKELHRAHHDMETVYWDLLWTFVRALPEGADPNSVGVVAYELKEICGNLLTHQLGDESSRHRYLRPADNFKRFLHGRLARFAGLLESLAIYFSIPWHIYLGDGTVDIDHAHHAVRRLLLPEIIHLRSTAGQGANVPLDKTQPRIFQSPGIVDRTTIDNTDPWGRGTGSKRKWAEVEPSQGAQPGAKKAKAAEVRGEDAPPKRDVHPRSAEALRKLFHDSRLLWFGTGRRG